MQSKIPCLVEFAADWCGPCHINKPILDEIEFEYHGLVIKKSVNIEGNELLINNLDIKYLPTVVIFHDGIEIQRFIGIIDKKDIVDRIEKLLIS